MLKKVILWNLLAIHINVNSPSLTMPIVKSLFIVTKPTQFFVCLPQKIPLKQDSLDETSVESFVHEVTIEELHEQISNLAVDVVRDLQEISFDVVHDMKTVVSQVRELRHDKEFKKYARHVMKDVLITSRIVMDFVNDLDNIIQLLKSQFSKAKKQNNCLFKAFAQRLKRYYYFVRKEVANLFNSTNILIQIWYSMTC